MNSIKASRSDKAIKTILAATYPEWKGRKIRVCVATTYQMMNYWSEGSRHYVVAYALASGRVAGTSNAAATPWNAEAHALVEIPEGVLLVEHSIFCGKDAGVTIYVHPSNVGAMLPAAPATCAHPVTIELADGAKVCTGCEAVH